PADPLVRRSQTFSGPISKSALGLPDHVVLGFHSTVHLESRGGVDRIARALVRMLVAQRQDRVVRVGWMGFVRQLAVEPVSGHMSVVNRDVYLSQIVEPEDGGKDHGMLACRTVPVGRLLDA